MLAGAAILFGYGMTLNLAPLDFGPLIGAYVATFFVVGQIINLVIFRTPPSLPIIVGGLFILTGRRDHHAMGWVSLSKPVGLDRFRVVRNSASGS
jgi:hypothetical protein